MGHGVALLVNTWDKLDISSHFHSHPAGKVLCISKLLLLIFLASAFAEVVVISPEPLLHGYSLFIFPQHFTLIILLFRPLVLLLSTSIARLQD